MNNMTNLLELENIHKDIDLTKSLNELEVAKGKFKFYHYKCDFFDDIGWGCGYRTLQMICSWINEQILRESKLYNIDNVVLNNIPSIPDIQKILVQSGDKNSDFIDSKEWIGCFETSIVIDTLYNVSCKILHCSPGDLFKYTEIIAEHFRNFGSPIAIGGNLDNSSKGILGLAVDSDLKVQFLVTNPHFVTKNITKKSDLFEGNWIEWRSIDSFDSESFYNLCLPQVKAKF